MYWPEQALWSMEYLVVSSYQKMPRVFMGHYTAVTFFEKFNFMMWSMTRRKPMYVAYWCVCRKIMQWAGNDVTKLLDHPWKLWRLIISEPLTPGMQVRLSHTWFIAHACTWVDQSRVCGSRLCVGLAVFCRMHVAISLSADYRAFCSISFACVHKHNRGTAQIFHWHDSLCKSVYMQQ